MILKKIFKEARHSTEKSFSVLLNEYEGLDVETENYFRHGITIIKIPPVGESKEISEELVVVDIKNWVKNEFYKSRYCPQ